MLLSGGGEDGLGQGTEGGRSVHVLVFVHGGLLYNSRDLRGTHGVYKLLVVALNWGEIGAQVDHEGAEALVAAAIL